MDKITSFFILSTLFLLQSYLIRFSIGPYPSNLLEIFIVISTLSFLITTIHKKQLLQTIKNIGNYAPIILLLIITVMAITVPEPPFNSYLLSHLKFIAFGSLFTFITLEHFKTAPQREQAIYTTGLGAITFGLFSLIYNLLGHNITHDYRLLGPLDAAVYLAFYLTPFFIYFSLKYLENHQHWKRFLILSIISGLLLLGTRSIGAITASFIILAYHSIKYQRLPFFTTKTYKWILAILTAGVLTTVFITKILPGLQTNYSSINERGEIYAVSMELLKTPSNIAFGLGLGQFQIQYEDHATEILNRPPLDFKVLQPHNVFLLAIFNFGLPGLLLLLITIFVIIKKSRQATPYSFDAIIIWMLCYLFLHSLIDSPIFKNDILIIALLLISTQLNRRTQGA